MAGDAERVRRAALLAPLAVPVVLWLAWAVETTPSIANLAAGFWGFLLVGGPAAYVVAGVLGWPVYRILRRLDAVWLTTCLVSGFLIGVIVGSVLWGGVGTLIVGALAGAVAGGTFWVIGVRPASPRGAPAPRHPRPPMRTRV